MRAQSFQCFICATVASIAVAGRASAAIVATSLSEFVAATSNGPYDDNLDAFPPTGFDANTFTTYPPVTRTVSSSSGPTTSSASVVINTYDGPLSAGPAGATPGLTIDGASVASASFNGGSASEKAFFTYNFTLTEQTTFTRNGALTQFAGPNGNITAFSGEIGPGFYQFNCLLSYDGDGGFTAPFNLTIAPVPEPVGASLFAVAGLLGAGAARRRRRGK